MKNINWSGAMRSLALVAAAACAVPSAVASDRLDGLFSKIEPSLRERAFMRLNYIHVNVKTTSGDAYDVTGPVVARGDLGRWLGSGSGYTSMFNSGSGTTVPAFFYGIAGNGLDAAMVNDGRNANCPSLQQGLGTPCGVRAKSDTTVGTPAISVGFFLDQQMNWVLEAFLLAAPIKAEVYGDGPNALNGRKIIETKLLPPTVVLGRYFGSANSRIRPFVGLGGSYALFMDTRATQALNTYQGGGSSDDTTVSIKNALGFGPFFGVKGQLDDDWHISLNVGKLRYKTDATLVTRNTTIVSGAEVLKDYGPEVTRANNTTIEALPQRPTTVAVTGSPDGFVAGQAVGGVTGLICDLAKSKYGRNDCNLGTFVRKQSTTLDNTLFMLSVGRRF